MLKHVPQLQHRGRQMILQLLFLFVPTNRDLSSLRYGWNYKILCIWKYIGTSRKLLVRWSVKYPACLNGKKTWVSIKQQVASISLSAVALDSPPVGGDKVHVPSSVSCSFLALRNQSVESREPKKEVISVTEALPRKGGRAGTRTGWYQCWCHHTFCLRWKGPRKKAISPQVPMINPW